MSTSVYKPIIKTITIAAASAYTKLSATELIASGRIAALSTNSGTATLKDSDGHEMSLIKGDEAYVNEIDLSQLQVKGTENDVLTFIGTVS
jgi:hypothetical protein